jgi:hypothetical protein
MKCHSERSEESCSGSGGPPKKGQGEIPRFARNDGQFRSQKTGVREQKHAKFSLRFLNLRPLTLPAQARRDWP